MQSRSSGPREEGSSAHSSLSSSDLTPGMVAAGVLMLSFQAKIVPWFCLSIVIIAPPVTGTDDSLSTQALQENYPRLSSGVHLNGLIKWFKVLCGKLVVAGKRTLDRVTTWE